MTPAEAISELERIRRETEAMLEALRSAPLASRLVGVAACERRLTAVAMAVDSMMKPDAAVEQKEEGP